MPTSPVIVITGASSGIGAAAARLFGVQEKYRVVLAARRIERLEAIADEIQRAGGQALPLAVDVTQFDQLQHLVDASLAHFGQIDVLVNNAGLGYLKWLEALDPVREINPQLQVNLTGIIWLTRLVLPHMIEQGRGHIINISSIAGLVPLPTYSIYSATKFGLRGFTEALRYEVMGLGIHVSGIYPGSASTEFGNADRTRKVGTPKKLRLTADDVAKTMLRALKRPRRVIIIPGYMRILVFFYRHFPRLTEKIITRQFKRDKA